MEIKIGIQEASRELVLSSNKSQDEVDKLISEALRSDDGLLRLTDDKGRTVVVPVTKLAYVELTPAEARRVGFVGDT
ncbi:DUF3107 domain-containing protein [Haloechinothrix sp. LS1_15]|uniref:DUF3107 domain-containing protein n=1 Tax=Haloechinothrix sp. LS1_15 TaxID=2652248 RepID=UPI00294854BF|nr:DUF3107 domain-containing protein [Haloechinothrix sp. LS1_15]MDV6013871.1 DUF3107 domain-containing protein [Haloechinothrix sp. LS1_15]